MGSTDAPLLCRFLSLIPSLGLLPFGQGRFACRDCVSPDGGLVNRATRRGRAVLSALGGTPFVQGKLLARVTVRDDGVQQEGGNSRRPESDHRGGESGKAQKAIVRAANPNAQQTEGGGEGERPENAQEESGQPKQASYRRGALNDESFTLGVSGAEGSAHNTYAIICHIQEVHRMTPGFVLRQHWKRETEQSERDWYP